MCIHVLHHASTRCDAHDQNMMTNDQPVNQPPPAWGYMDHGYVVCSVVSLHTLLYSLCITVCMSLSSSYNFFAMTVVQKGYMYLNLSFFLNLKFSFFSKMKGGFVNFTSLTFDSL